MERRPQTRTKAKTMDSQLLMASHVSNQQRGYGSEHLNRTPVTPLEGPLILPFARVVLQPGGPSSSTKLADNIIAHNS